MANSQNAISPIKRVKVPRHARNAKIHYLELVALAKEIEASEVEYLVMRQGDPPRNDKVGVTSVKGAEKILADLLDADRFCGGPFSQEIHAWGDKRAESENLGYNGSSGDFNGRSLGE